MNTMILKNAKIISPADEMDFVGDIKITDGIISEIGTGITYTTDDIVKDCTGLVVSPGFVEMHAHLRTPGFEKKETHETGLAAAISGGYTALCAMANTSPVVDNEILFEYLQNKAKDISPVEFHQICAVTKELNSKKLTDFRTLQKKGAIAFSDDGKPIENLLLLRYALEYAQELDSLILLHSEVSELARGGIINESLASVKAGLQGIPTIAESAAIARELEVIRAIGNVRVHFCHISTKRSVELIRQAKKDGLNITCETAPHYFSLTDEDIKSYDARYKMNPPLRSKEDKEAIIEGIIDRTIDVIATDHAPHTEAEKTDVIQNSPMGIVGLETSLGVTMTELVKKNYISVNRVIELLSVNPAKVLRLVNQGCIKKGNNSNLIVFNPNRKYIVEGKNFKSKCKVTPFEGMELFGKIEFVVINGKIYE